ncbi:hypothetical protein GCM10025856_23630 [Methylophaga marina]|nr:hypothetical protein GCM10025856_23630 [Methylophaga marina]
MKVDFMIIGAQKCATTTLFDILNKHPQLEGCAEKEPGFFAKKTGNLVLIHIISYTKKGMVQSILRHLPNIHFILISITKI